MSQFTVSAWAADSSLSASYTPDNAGDERWSSAANERWVSANVAMPHWLRADLGTAQVAEWYRVDPGRTGSDPTAWTFEGSNDTSSWTTLDTRSGESFADSQTKTYTFTNATAYRYYRLNISAGQASAASVAELALGDGSPHAAVWEHKPVGVNGSGNYTLGLVFVANAAIEVQALSVWVGNSAGTWKARIRDSSGAVVAGEATYTALSTEVGWREIAITPVTLAAGTYMIEQYGGGVRFPYRSGSHASAVSYGVAGEVTVPANGTVTFRSDTKTARLGTGDTEPTGVFSGEPLNGFRFAAAAAGGTTGSGTAVAPAGVTSGSGTVLTTTTGSGAATAPAGQASGSGAVIVTGSGAATAPAATSSGSGTVTGATVTGSGAATAPAAVGAGAGTVSAATVTGSGSAAAPAGVAAGDDAAEAADYVLDVSVDLTIEAEESQAPLVQADDTYVLDAAVDLDVVWPLAPSTPPAHATPRPLERHSHVMPALTAANPRYAEGIDYDVTHAEVGDLRYFVDGTEVTFKRDVPMFADYSHATGIGDLAATLTAPQQKPWDEPGEGDFAEFDMARDPEFDVVLVRPDDSLEYVWEGYLARDRDSSGAGRMEYVYDAEGLLSQAMHELYDPPVIQEPVDPGHLVADILNSVTHRRWLKIRRFTTGLEPVTERGQQGWSKWQMVQHLLSLCFDDDLRQLTIVKKARRTYAIEWKQSLDVADWTVTKGAPGVDVDLSRDQSSRLDSLYGRGVAPDGAAWGNYFWPGLEFYTIPAYPMAGFAVISTGTTDATTTTGAGVTKWQRRMRELGYNVRVDGVMNAADVPLVQQVQRDSGILVDGILGPQTWAATFNPGQTEQDLTRVRRPLATTTTVEPFLYAANGAVIGANPGDDRRRVRRSTEVDFGNRYKRESRPLARQMRARLAEPPHVGTIKLLTDPHEGSRFDIRVGDNIAVRGHRGDVIVQVSEVRKQGLEVNLTVDSAGLDVLATEAIITRDQQARRDPTARTSRPVDLLAFSKSEVVEYESESKAGFFPRTAVNGNAGLWTVLPIFVSQLGVAKIEFHTAPDAEIVVALCGKKITANRLATYVPDPLADDSGWYDHKDVLQGKFGVLEVFGSSNSPGGYSPWQKAADKGLTGDLEASAGTLLRSLTGGFYWVGVFTSRSTWVEGRVFPGTGR